MYKCNNNDVIIEKRVSLDGNYKMKNKINTRGRKYDNVIILFLTIYAFMSIDFYQHV